MKIQSLLSLHSQRKKDREAGFSMIELMIVMVILSLLALIGLPLFAQQQEKSRDSQVQSDMKNVAMEIETLLAYDSDAEEFSLTRVNEQDQKATLQVGSQNTVISYSRGSQLNVSGSSVGGNYYICGWNPSGKNYKTNASLYNSDLGGFTTTTVSSEECGGFNEPAWVYEDNEHGGSTGNGGDAGNEFIGEHAAIKNDLLRAGLAAQSVFDQTGAYPSILEGFSTDGASAPQNTSNGKFEILVTTQPLGYVIFADYPVDGVTSLETLHGISSWNGNTVIKLATPDGALTSNENIYRQLDMPYDEVVDGLVNGAAGHGFTF